MAIRLMDSILPTLELCVREGRRVVIRLKGGEEIEGILTHIRTATDGSIEASFDGRYWISAGAIMMLRDAPA